MILVLCNSFKESQSGFAIFMDFLEKYNPLGILKVFEHSYCVETDDNYRYIFIDRRLRNLFKKVDAIDEVDSGEFFETLYSDT